MKKKLIVSLAIFATSCAFASQGLLQMVQMVETVKQVKQLKSAIKAVEDYKSIEEFADLKLWYIRQTQPKIFIDIEMADNATDMGYFRLDYHKATKIGKLGLLKKHFNVK